MDWCTLAQAILNGGFVALGWGLTRLSAKADRKHQRDDAERQRAWDKEDRVWKAGLEALKMVNSQFPYFNRNTGLLTNGEIVQVYRSHALVLPTRPKEVCLELASKCAEAQVKKDLEKEVGDLANRLFDVSREELGVESLSRD